MLTDTFFDWWFAPWAYAAHPLSSLPATDCLGQRDAYRLWCEEARLRPDLPERCDPAWSIAALHDAGVLLSAARLFAGLVAARQYDRTVLDALKLDERKWCASISAIQPLQSFHDMRVASSRKIETRGLVELAARLERGFPGMWPRLRLLLAADMAGEVDGLLRSTIGAGDHGSASDRRAQRCWRLCLERVVDPGS
jgi:hypothetical protein